jgi:hypothetical protein
MSYENEEEIAERNLRCLCEQTIACNNSLAEKWPILAEKYRAYLPDRIILLMKEILATQGPIRLERAYNYLGNMNRLETIRECLIKDLNIVERLNRSDSLYFLAIEQSIKEQNEFPRYFNVNQTNRIFYLASLKYLEKYTKKISEDLASLAILQSETQKKLTQAIETKEQHHLSNLQEITRAINVPLNSEETIIEQCKEYFNHPTVTLANENLAYKPTELVNLLNQITLKHWEILDQNKNLNKMLETLNEFIQAHTIKRA